LKPEEEAAAHKEVKDVEKKNEEGEGEGETKKKIPKRT